MKQEREKSSELSISKGANKNVQMPGQAVLVVDVLASVIGLLLLLQSSIPLPLLMSLSLL